VLCIPVHPQTKLQTTLWEVVVLKVHLCDLPAFMIASQQCHMCRISSFQQHEQSERFQAVVTPVNKVTHEDVVGAWHFSPGGKQLEQVMKLTMDVSTNL
jgi:hypothetical protein